MTRKTIHIMTVCVGVSYVGLQLASLYHGMPSDREAIMAQVWLAASMVMSFIAAKDSEEAEDTADDTGHV